MVSGTCTLPLPLLLSWDSASKAVSKGRLWDLPGAPGSADFCRYCCTRPASAAVRGWALEELLEVAGRGVSLGGGSARFLGCGMREVPWGCELGWSAASPERPLRDDAVGVAEEPVPASTAAVLMWPTWIVWLPGPGGAAFCMQEEWNELHHGACLGTERCTFFHV